MKKAECVRASPSAGGSRDHVEWWDLVLVLFV